MDTLPEPGLIYTVAMFAIVIGVLVFVHEYGHYFAGRLFGIKAETFSIGFGRELAGWTDRSGTRWKIALLPLGGYVKFAGDLNAASQPRPSELSAMATDRAAMFQFRPLWQRAVVILAGPVTNFSFAILVFTVFFMTYGHSFTPAVISQVVAGSPASAAGLRSGDHIVRLDQKNVERFEDVVRIISLNSGTPIDATVDRSGNRFNVRITPQIVGEVDRFGNRYTKGQLGIGSGGRIIQKCSPTAAVYDAVKETWMLTGAMVDGLWQVVGGRRPVSELGGPLKIAKFSGQQAALGLPNLVQFMALISINLGFINLLPVPTLDGGHLFLYAVEAMRRRPLAPKVQEWAFMSGFVALMSLMVLLTWNDLASVGVWHHLAGLLG